MKKNNSPQKHNFENLPNDVQKLIKNFFREKKLAKSDFSVLTERSYRTDLMQFFQVVSVPLRELTKYDLADYYEWLDGTSPTVATKNRKATVIRQFLTYLFAEGMIEKPIPVQHYKENQRTAPEYAFTQEVYSLLMEEVKRRKDARTYALFLMLRYMGLRIFEALALPIEAITVPVYEIEGKGKKKRQIYITDGIRDAVLKYLKQEGRDLSRIHSPIFPITRQRAHALVAFYAKRLPPEYQTACHPHAFRHLFCRESIPIIGLEMTAQLAGHSDINTTRGYVTFSKKEISQKINAMSLVQQEQEKELAKAFKQAERKAERAATKAEKLKKKRGRPKGIKKNNKPGKGCRNLLS